MSSPLVVRAVPEQSLSIGERHSPDAGPATGERPLRICLLTYRGKPTCGGQGIYVKKLSRALRDLGHEPHVISGPPYPDVDPDIPLHRLPSLDLYNPEALFRTPTLRELCSPINVVEWVGVSTQGFPEPLTFGFRAFLYLRRLARSFDVVHDNQSLSYGILGIQRLGVPVVATIHHPVTVDRDAEIQSAGVWWKRLKVRRWYSFVPMQARVSRRLSRIITVSETSKKDISSAFRIPPERFRVVPNGIDTEVFRPLPDIQREPNRLIVTNSADMPLKGMRFLLEAVAALAARRPVRLTVIGTPKKDGEIEKLVRDLNLGEIVTFTGRIEEREIPVYYARSTLAVVPSLYEGFGLPAAEAMACGIPVVSTTGGALPEVVGDAGELVPPGDSAALAGAIASLLDNPARRLALGKAGYDRIQKFYTWRRAAEKVAEVYREALRDNGRLLQA
jgi:glycosyltransferase involved in cell wall biosynthesis